MTYRLPSGYLGANYKQPTGYGPAPSQGAVRTISKSVSLVSLSGGETFVVLGDPNETVLLTLTMVDGTPADATEININVPQDDDELADIIAAAVNTHLITTAPFIAFSLNGSVRLEAKVPGVNPGGFEIVDDGDWLGETVRSAGVDPVPGRVPLCIGKLRGAAEYIIPYEPPGVS